MHVIRHAPAPDRLNASDNTNGPEQKSNHATKSAPKPATQSGPSQDVARL